VDRTPGLVDAGKSLLRTWGYEGVRMSEPTAPCSLNVLPMFAQKVETKLLKLLKMFIKRPR